MALQRGTKLGPYQIESPLGAGPLRLVILPFIVPNPRPFPRRGDGVTAL